MPKKNKTSGTKRRASCLSQMILPLVLSLLVQYPIPQLGGCDTQLSCKNYCDIPWHHTVCTQWEEGARNAQGSMREVLGEETTNVTFPIPELGNCYSKDSCKLYCDDPANKPACVNWARQHGIDTSVEASGGKAPSTRPGGGEAGITFPIAQLGNCGSKSECMAYCDQPGHRNECMAFAQAHGLNVQGGPPAGMPSEGPGGCKSESECDSYCKTHGQECYEWGKAHSMADRGGPPPGEGGSSGAPSGGPGGCNSAQSCDSYCKTHGQECATWAEKNGLGGQRPGGPQQGEKQSPEGTYGGNPQGNEQPGKGPGGCQSEAECRAYCEKNPQECGGGSGPSNGPGPSGEPGGPPEGTIPPQQGQEQYQGQGQPRDQSQLQPQPQNQLQPY